MTESLRSEIAMLGSICVILSILESKIPRVFLSGEVISLALCYEAYPSFFRDNNKN